jgi:hypothetical protein
MDYWRTTADRLRVPMSILIVSFPVFIWTVWFIKKLIKQTPELKDFRVRRWLMYFTIFAAAVIIIVTLIVVLNNFFNGEITIRFLLKILSVLIIAASVLWYYLIEVKEDNKKALVQKIIAWFIITLVLASIIIGFVVMGSPMKQRERKIDNQRITDLQSIFYSVENYYREFRTMPKVLEDLKGMSVSMATFPIDPATREPYIYEYSEGTRFKLCATFSEPLEGVYSNQVTPYYAYGMNNDWDHSAGYYCFIRNVGYVDTERGMMETNLKVTPAPFLQ